jgi:hypothetical protein
MDINIDDLLTIVVIRDPPLVMSSGGMRPLTDALGDGSFDASEGLTAAFLYLLDVPERRKFLRCGSEIEVLVLLDGCGT